MDGDDTGYYFQRAEFELARVRLATTPEPRIAHQQLADRYLARCAGTGPALVQPACRQR